MSPESENYAISVTGSQNVVVTNCSVHFEQENVGSALGVFSCSGVWITDNDIEILQIFSASNVYASGNRITGIAYLYGTSGSSYNYNEVAAYADVSSVACLQLVPYNQVASTNNQIVGNHLNGSWKGSSPAGTQGADDAIVLIDTSDVLVEENVIENVWDAGIESVGLLSDTVIADNWFGNIEFPAVGAYINTSWQRVTVSGNFACNALYLVEIGFDIEPNLSPLAPVPATIVFQSNQIVDNTFESPRSASTLYASLYTNSMDVIMGDCTANGTVLTCQPYPIAADSNIIANNRLPIQAPGPFLYPASAFIDGGLNVCGPPPAGSPIKCLPAIVSQSPR